MVRSASGSGTATAQVAYRGAAGVFVHLPVAAEEDRRLFADNILTAVRAARPDRVVFSTSGFPLDPAIGGAAAALAAGLADSGVSHAAVAPELYLEKLLMPFVLDSIRERGVLTYPTSVGAFHRP
ncbi:hypothetical protein AB0C21_39760 [Spirillospora sp. NPDC049024]